MDDNKPASPNRVRLRLVHKLFLLLGVGVLLALATFAALSLFNLRQGFVAYLNALDAQRLGTLALALERRDDAGEGFIRLRDRPAWDALLRETFGGPGRPEPPAPGATAGTPPPPSAPPPPPPAESDAAAPVPLLPRISLLDARRALVAGPAPSTDALLRPLYHEGVAVGWLALRPLTRPEDSRDTSFLATQARWLAFSALALLLLALGLAWVFARHLLRPLQQAARVAARLADGDYAARAVTGRRDELGDLVAHVNRLGAALQANEGARRRWIADISHELRTPLAIVRGEVEAMQDGLRDLDGQALRSLHDEIMRLDQLVGDLHQLSISDLGALSLRPRSIDLAALVESCCARFAGAATAAGLELHTAIDAVEAQADPDRLRQLFDNLLANSMRYTDRGGRIEVEVRTLAGHAVRIRVQDSAPGVDADALALLFEPLYRGEASRDRRHGGSGLGLAIAERIAIAHGGSLHASPSPLGGLRMDCVLPREPRA